MPQTVGDTDLAKLRMAQILDATTKLVAELGGDNVKLRDISGETGLSIGTLQHYFVTRDNLLTAAFLHHHQQVVASIAAVNDKSLDPWTRLCAMFDTLTLPESLKQRSRLWIEMTSKGSRDEQIRRAAQKVYEMWREVFLETVKEGIECGHFRPVLSREETVNAILAIVDGNEIALLLETDGHTPEQVNERLKVLASVLLSMDPNPRAG